MLIPFLPLSQLSIAAGNRIYKRARTDLIQSYKILHGLDKLENGRDGHACGNRMYGMLATDILNGTTVNSLSNVNWSR